MSFSKAVNALELLARESLSGDQVARAAGAAIGVDLSDLFRRTVGLKDRRSYGAFFTDESIGKELAKGVPPTARVCDPTCGVGNLFMPHVHQLMTESSLDDTLDSWGNQLIGCEIQPELLRAAKARIALQAAARFRSDGGRRSRTKRSPNELFPLIRVGDALTEYAGFAGATHVWLNPPYAQVNAPRGCEWARGRTTIAALFVERCVKEVDVGVHISAILPDVLRSGSRYGRWRSLIEERCSINRIATIGRFDQHTDVDVFLLEMTVRNRSSRPVGHSDPWVLKSSGETVGDYFRARVGPLVDYRTESKGNWRPYLDVTEAKPWETIRRIPRSRRFSGPLCKPPFVAVRRTSSPHERKRAIASLILDSRPVAVENHLIVLAPFDGTVRRCRELMDVLVHGDTTSWLNARIRCRHLTKDSVLQIPWK